MSIFSTAMRPFRGMKIRANLAAALLCLIVAAPAGMQPAPWFGTWQLKSQESAGPFADPAYKRVTSHIEPLGDGLKVSYDMVRTRGGITHVEWVGRFDGRDYPVQGMDYVLTNAYRVLDDRSYEIVIKVDGQVAATAVAVVSPDGRTLTVSTRERRPGGGTSTTTALYERR
jgi:hypothetical protein